MGVNKICKLKAESSEKEWPGRDWTEKVSNEFVPSFLRVMMPGYSGNFLSGKKNFTREISTSFTLKVWSVLFPSSHAVTSLTSLPSWNDKGSLKRSFVEMCEFWAIFIRSCLPWSRVVKDRNICIWVGRRLKNIKYEVQDSYAQRIQAYLFCLNC